MIRPVLPPCSVRDCTSAAGVILNGALLCGEHAKAALDEQKRRKREEDGADSST